MSKNIGDKVGQSMLNGLVPGAKRADDVPPADDWFDDDRYNDRGFKPHPDDHLFDRETGEFLEPRRPKAKAAKFKVPIRVAEELSHLGLRQADIDKLDFSGARTILADAISQGRTSRSWGEQLITEMEAMQPDTPDQKHDPLTGEVRAEVNMDEFPITSELLKERSFTLGDGWTIDELTDTLVELRDEADITEAEYLSAWNECNAARTTAKPDPLDIPPFLQRKQPEKFGMRMGETREEADDRHRRENAIAAQAPLGHGEPTSREEAQRITDDLKQPPHLRSKPTKHTWDLPKLDATVQDGERVITKNDAEMIGKAIADKLSNIMDGYGFVLPSTSHDEFVEELKWQVMASLREAKWQTADRNLVNVRVEDAS